MYKYVDNTELFTYPKLAMRTEKIVILDKDDETRQGTGQGRATYYARLIYIH